MTVYTSDNPVNAPRVCVLGTGAMGAGMARNVAAAGLETRAWNRTAVRAAPLVEAGVIVHADLTAAVRDVDVVITMLWDAATVETVLRGAGAGWAPGAVLLQTSTVGVDGAARLGEVAAGLGLRYVDAPVQGTRQPAEEGRLVVLASGPDDTRQLLAPVLAAIGSRVVWLGEAGLGSRLKLATNAFVVNMTAAIAESMQVLAALGLDPARFLEAIVGGSLESPYVSKKCRAILDGDLTPAFSVEGGLKDARLIASAADQAGIGAPLTRVTERLLTVLTHQGYGGEDIAALGRSVIGGDDR